MTRGLWIAALALLLAGCRARATFDTPVPPDDTFARAAPTAAEAERFARAARYSAAEDGLALLVLRGDRLLFADFPNGNRPETPHHIFSGTKSFSGVMVMAAVADGLLDLDERVAETLPELRGDPRKERITVRQLLDFTSGWEGTFRFTWDALHVPQRIDDKYAEALALDVDHAPGQRYRYGGAHQQVLGAFLTRKLGEDPIAYLRRRVTDRIGMRIGGWLRDPAGNPMLPFGAWLTAHEWAKFGVFLLQGGRWGDEQIIPAELLAQCYQGSAAMPAYGLTFWLNRPVPDGLVPDLLPSLRDPARRGAAILPGGPADLVTAAGHHGNRCYVIPSRNLVIVRLGNGNGLEDERLLRLLLGMDPE